MTDVGIETTEQLVKKDNLSHHQDYPFKRLVELISGSENNSQN
jgi:hypothetical protein